MNQVTVDKSFIKNSTKSDKLLDYIYMYVSIGISGIIFFISKSIQPIAVVFLVILFLVRKKKIIKSSLGFVSFVLVIFLLQCIKYNTFSTNNFTTILIKFGAASVVLSYFRNDFVKAYVNVMYYIALLSLIIYFLRLLIPGVDGLLHNLASVFNFQSRNSFYEYKPNLIVYTLHNISRNSGPFWEPGGYGIFLILALVFNYILTQKIFDKKSFFFIISIITTLSTTTIIALFVFLLFISTKKSFYSILLIPVLLMVFSYVYSEYKEIFEKKISLRLDISQRRDYYRYAPNRFTSFMMDLDVIKENPILGQGRTSTVRGEKNHFYSLMDHRNNGISNIATRYGLIYFLVFYFFLFISVKKVSLYYGISNSVLIFGVFFTIVLMTSSEIVTEKLILLVIAQLFLVYNKKAFNYEK